MTAALVSAMEAVLGRSHVRTGAAVAALHPGEHPDNLGAGIVVSPDTTQQVAAIVGLCRQHGASIVPQGGRTGLVGGGVSQPGQVVLSLLRMNRIAAIDRNEAVAVVEAGATLQALQAAALAVGLEPGIDIAARGSATIGGMISTNAGGVMAFRNGVMRHRILGIEAVLADGSIYRDMVRVVKNSAGYDLKQLFIGAEGTLGIVTRAVLKLETVPAATATALFALPSTAAALDAVRLARGSDSAMTAAEVLWSRYFQFTAGHFGWTAADYRSNSPVHLLIGLGGSDEAVLHGSMAALYQSVLELHPETTAVLASSGAQEKALWALREETSLIYRSFPGAPSYDISIPLPDVETFLDRAMTDLAAIEAGIDPFVFGHLADGNLHIVLNRPGSWLTPVRRDAIEAVLYTGIGAAGGSFSAEHGVGSKRIHSLILTADPVKLALMATIKQTLDPAGLFNPGKVLPVR